MALIGNGSRKNIHPAMVFGTSADLSFQNQIRQGELNGRLANLTAGQGISDNTVGYMNGASHPNTWRMAMSVGRIGAINVCSGSATLTGRINPGINISSNFAKVDSTQVGTFTEGHVLTVAINQWVVSTTTAGLNFAPSDLGVKSGQWVDSTQTGSMAADGWLTVKSGQWTDSTVSLATYATGALLGAITPYSILSPESLATAVWSDMVGNYQVAGSTGKALASAGSAGDPWGTLLPGSYGAGTAGELVGQIADVLSATTTIKGLTHENFLMKDQVFDSNDRLISATVRIFANATDCQNDTNPIDEYTISSSYGAGATFRTVKV